MSDGATLERAMLLSLALYGIKCQSRTFAGGQRLAQPCGLTLFLVLATSLPKLATKNTGWHNATLVHEQQNRFPVLLFMNQSGIMSASALWHRAPKWHCAMFLLARLLPSTAGVGKRSI